MRLDDVLQILIHSMDKPWFQQGTKSKQICFHFSKFDFQDANVPHDNLESCYTFEGKIHWICHKFEILEVLLHNSVQNMSYGNTFLKIDRSHLKITPSAHPNYCWDGENTKYFLSVFSAIIMICFKISWQSYHPFS